MTSLHDAPSSLDRLPPDQRAVLQMVLARGQSYDQIAKLLSIDRAAVRQRALAAFDALGPATRVAAGQRALITDYLLGQLPAAVSDDVRRSLGESASERAWARVVASELASIAPGSLPEIPVRSVEREPKPKPPRRAPRPRAKQSDASPVEAQPAPDVGGPAAAGGAAADAAAEPAAEGTVAEPSAEDAVVAPAAREQPRPRVSRLGGAILLGGAAAVAIALILIFVVFAGGSGRHRARAGTHALTTGSSSARPLAQINLTSPTGGRAVGIAEVIKAGSATGVVIVAQGLAPNTKHDAYAVWLYNSASDSYRLGYVQQAVTSTGKLQTAGRLPANASHFKQILIALQTGPANQPGKIVLEGPLSGV